jgi:hypothetical protein
MQIGHQTASFYYSNQEKVNFSSNSNNNNVNNNMNNNNSNIQQQQQQQHVQIWTTHFNFPIPSIPRKSFGSFQTDKLLISLQLMGESWFQEKMGNLIPTPNTFQSITKSVVPANPRTSQVKLNI